MKTRAMPRLQAIAAILVISATASAGTTFFGPKTYTVTSGQPQTLVENVSVDESQRCDGKASFILVVQNGSGTTAVDSARITINGAAILTESEFKPESSLFEIPVRLLASNSIGLVLKGGRPGSSLTVAIRKEIEEPAASKSYTLSDKEQSFAEIFQIPDPTSIFNLIVQSGDEAGSHRPKSFSIRLNGVEVATEKDFVGNATRLRKPVTLQNNNGLNLDIRGDAGDVLSVAVKRQLDESACGPKVFFETPADNSVVTARRIVVTGTATGTKDLGITVNGRVAEIDLAHAGTLADPFRWFDILETVPAGSVTLEAVAKDGRGGVGRASRSISFSPTAEIISIRPLAAAGVAPFAASFEVVLTNAASTIKSYDIDFNGDGQFDLAGATTLPDPLTFNYPTPGLYRVTLRANDANGSAYPTITYVAVVSPAAIDSVVQTRWHQLREHLAAQDVEGAVGLFSGEAQAKYRRVFTDLFSRLSAIAGGMTSPAAISIHADYADYLVTRVEDGKTMGYHLTMMRDANGVWKVADF